MYAVQCDDYNAVVVYCDALRYNVMVSCCDDDVKEWMSVGGVSVV